MDVRKSFTSSRFPGPRGHAATALPRMMVPPGVYRPKTDTRLLAGALAQENIGPGTSVLDLCAGSGVIGLAAAGLGAREVTAVDISVRAVWTARFNSWVRGARVRVLRGGVAQACRFGPFDMVLANPPYVPCPDGPTALRSDRWDGGPDGRRVLDALCVAADTMLSPTGTMLIVQSAFAGEHVTIAALNAHGLDTTVVARDRVCFGPVVRSRSRYLLNRGLWSGAVCEEELVVIRGQRK